MSDLSWFLLGAVIAYGTLGAAGLFWLDRMLRKYRFVPRSKPD